MSYSPRLKEKYKKEVIPSLQKQFNYSNSMMVPKLKKICINQGIGDAVGDKKMIEAALKDLTTVTGQKAVPTKSRKDISNFKLRKGVAIGTRVTLRGDNMYEFLDRLIAVALPRTRDFRGVSPKGFDGHGNFTFGVKEHIIFPEMDIDKVNKILGMDITFVTSAKSNEEAHALIKEFGFPFIKK